MIERPHYDSALDRMTEAERECIAQDMRDDADRFAAMALSGPPLDYRGRPPFEPEPRPTVRAVLAEMGWQDAALIALWFVLIVVWAYAVAVASGVAG